MYKSLDYVESEVYGSYYNLLRVIYIILNLYTETCIYRSVVIRTKITIASRIHSQFTLTTINIGGSGFIGESVTKKLLNKGEDVVCFDIREPKGINRRNFSYRKVNITDYTELSESITMYDPEKIVNFAYMLNSETENNPRKATNINCVGSNNVFQVAGELGVPRVVFGSSTSVYGHPKNNKDIIFEDDEIPATYSQYPLYLYFAMKQLNEYQAKYYSDKFDIEIITVRPSVVFGPGRESGIAVWASNFISDPALGKEGAIPLPGDQMLEMVFIDDVVDLVSHCLMESQVNYPSYNTGGHRLSVSELCDLVTDQLEEPVSFDDSAPYLKMVSNVSYKRASEDFGYDLTPMQDAIRLHVDYLKDDM